jgi:preprotein translocase subunit SecA
MDRLKMPEGEAIEHPWVTRAIENAQRKVEARNFDIRKQLLEYDDVANDQRKVIYQQRNELLESTDISETLKAMREDVVRSLVAEHVPPESLEEQWDIPGLEKAVAQELQLELPIQEWLKNEANIDEDSLRDRLIEAAHAAYESKIVPVESTAMRQYERAIMLQSLDSHWREHLSQLDYLRQGIHLRGYAQKNPKQEYKREAFQLFADMLQRIKDEVTKHLLTVQVRSREEVEQAERAAAALENIQYRHADFGAGEAEAMTEGEGVAVAEEEAAQPMRRGAKVGRNDPCPCGSGKKFKHCHGRLT